MIVDKVIDYLDGPGADMQDRDVQTAQALVGKTLRRNFGKRREGGPRPQSPSSSWACQRRRLFDADPTIQPEPLSARARRTFAFGDVTEAIGIALARQAGVEFASPDTLGRQWEIAAKCGPFDITGHLDAHLIHPDHGIVPVDYKSMSDYSFKRALAASTDPSGDWWERERWGIIAQMRWYLWILKQMAVLDPTLGPVADFGLIVAVDKSTGHMAELRVYQNDEDMDLLIQSFIGMGTLIGDMNEGLVTIDDLLTRVGRPGWTETTFSKARVDCGDGVKEKAEEINTKGGNRWRCGYCPYTEACWPGFKVVPMKSGPVWRRPIKSA